MKDNWLKEPWQIVIGHVTRIHHHFWNETHRKCTVCELRLGRQANKSETNISWTFIKFPIYIRISSDNHEATACTNSPCRCLQGNITTQTILELFHINRYNIQSQCLHKKEARNPQTFHTKNWARNKHRDMFIHRTMSEIH